MCAELDVLYSTVRYGAMRCGAVAVTVMDDGVALRANNRCNTPPARGRKHAVGNR